MLHETDAPNENILGKLQRPGWARGLGVRRTEWVVSVFLVYAMLIAAVLPVPPATRDRLLLINLAILAGYALLIYIDSVLQNEPISMLRDWLPLCLVVLAYREMGWLALPHTDFHLEEQWITWDRLLLRGGAKSAIEAFGPLLPSLLEIAYSVVHVLSPIAVLVLYFCDRRERVDSFLFVFVLGVLLCYAQFPLWPSEPPRAVFVGEDAPAYDTMFRRFNWWMLGNYGIHTSVFPSAHVGGAFSTAFGMRYALPEKKWISSVLIVIAALIAAATVYGRYHYLVDAVAGFLVAVFAFVVAKFIQTHGSHNQPVGVRTHLV